MLCLRRAHCVAPWLSTLVVMGAMGCGFPEVTFAPEGQADATIVDGKAGFDVPQVEAEGADTREESAVVDAGASEDNETSPPTDAGDAGGEAACPDNDKDG